MVTRGRYAGVDVPESESLAQCTERLKPFLDEQLIPDMRAAVDAFAAEGAQGTPTFVIASSENCIRALVAELEGLSDDQVPSSASPPYFPWPHLATAHPWRHVMMRVPSTPT